MRLSKQAKQLVLSLIVFGWIVAAVADAQACRRCRRRLFRRRGKAAVTATEPAKKASPKKETKAKAPAPATGYTDSPFLPGGKWRVHDDNRPRPKAVATPPGKAPGDAVVLFDGKDLSQWTIGGKPAKWKVESGTMEVNKTGSITSKDKFGDCQIHLEWASPSVVKSASQGRGNSGVMIMGLYEVQVLDSYKNKSYADGQAAAIYGQFPPAVNATRKPGAWQSYDIIFEAPRFKDGKLVKAAYLTVFHNGVLMHHRKKLIGQVKHKFVATYQPHAAELPLTLQDHGNPVRFRNVWVRKLKFD